MEENTETSIHHLCEKCKCLIGGSRHTPAHDDLVQTSQKQFKSQHGFVDEYNYKCKKCDQEWLHEKGNYGQGWV